VRPSDFIIIAIMNENSDILAAFNVLLPNSVEPSSRASAIHALCSAS